MPPLVRIDYPHRPRLLWKEGEHGRFLEFDTWVGRTYVIETDVDGAGSWNVVDTVQGDGLVWRHPIDESSEVALYRVTVDFD